MISKEQIEELAKWCGFEYKECNPNHPQMKDSPYGMGWFNKVDKGLGFHNLPDFRQDLNACFKYIVPKLQSIGWMARVQWSPLFNNDTGKRLSDWTGYAHIYNIDQNKPLSRTADYYAIDKESATALCLAVLKLIKEEKDG